MITEDKVIEIFCIADDSCNFFDAKMAEYTLKEGKKRSYHRDSTMSKAEVMLIMILFHDSGYRCLKHFYLDKVCKHMRHLFPHVVSYNRFARVGEGCCHTACPVYKGGSARQVYWHQFCGQHPSACVQEPEDSHPQDFQGHCPAGQMLHGTVLRLQAPPDMQRTRRAA